MSALTAEIGSRLVIISIPVKGAWQAPWPAARDEFITRWCEREKVPLIDLGEALARFNPQELYFRTDPHWNARGHRAAAEAIDQRLAPVLRDPPIRP